MNPNNPFEGIGIIGSLLIFFCIILSMIFGTGYMVGGPKTAKRWAGKFLSWVVIMARRSIAWVLRFAADRVSPPKKKR